MNDNTMKNPFFGNRQFRTHAQKYVTSVYDPFVLTRTKTITIAEQRAEYSRLRAIAIKRLQRLGESKYKTAPAYTYNKDKFIPLAAIKSDRQLAYKLSDVARFLRMQTSSISGLEKQRRNQIEALEKKGIPESELERFGEFMELARTMLSELEYDSEAIAQAYRDARDRGDLSKDHQILERWKSRLRREGKVKQEQKPQPKKKANLDTLSDNRWITLPE